MTKQFRRGTLNPALGKGQLTGALAAGAGALALASGAEAQSGGVVLPGATYQVLANGNAMVSYNGVTFSVPGGQYTEINGQLVVSEVVARTFAPQALTQGTIAPQISTVQQPVQVTQLQPVTTYTQSPVAPQPTYVQPQAAPQAVSYTTHTTTTQPGISYIDPSFAPAPAPVAAPATAGGLGSAVPGASFGGMGSTFLVIGGIAAAAGLAYLLLNGDDADATAADDTTTGTDTGTDTDTSTDTVTDTNADTTDPTILSVSTSSPSEAAAIGTSVGSVVATDDTGISSYAIIAGNAGNAFAIDSNGNITLINPLDAEGISTYNLVVRVSDAEGNFVDEIVTINVSGVDDEAPTFTSSSTVSVQEDLTMMNLATGLTVQANDVDSANTNITYSITGGNDATDFTINSTTGELTFVASPDYEAPDDFNGNNIYELVVTANDGSGNTSTQTISVTVTNNTADDVADTTNPVFAAAAYVGDVDEESAAGEFIVQVAATDNVAVIGYNITAGDPNGFFQVDAAGNITTTGPIDLETDGSPHNLTVEAFDAAGNTHTTMVTVTINDVNEAPTATPVPPAALTEDDPATGLAASVWGFADVDAGDVSLGLLTITGIPANGVLSLSGAPADADTDVADTTNYIIANGDVIAFADLALIQYEPNDNFNGMDSITYTVTDDDPTNPLTSDPATLELTIDPDADAPNFTPDDATPPVTEVDLGSFQSGDAFSVNLNDYFDDVDGDALTYSVSAGDALIDMGLVLDANTGIISGPFATNSSSPGDYLFTIEAEDPAMTTDTGDFSLILAADFSGTSLSSGEFTGSSAVDSYNFATANDIASVGDVEITTFDITNGPVDDGADSVLLGNADPATTFDVIISTGDDDDTISIGDDYANGTGMVTINSGDGDDTIDVGDDFGLSTSVAGIVAGEGDDEITVGTGFGAFAGHMTSIDLGTGGGRDVVIFDGSAGLVTDFVEINNFDKTLDEIDLSASGFDIADITVDNSSGTHTDISFAGGDVFLRLDDATISGPGDLLLTL